MIFLLTSDQRCVLIELSQGFRFKLDIFTHSALVLFHYFTDVEFFKVAVIS
jgi:hypothetical protein